MYVVVVVVFHIQCKSMPGMMGTIMKNSIYFLYPQLRLRPRARSNLRPLDRTYGLVCECGTPGALPKCLLATRAVRLPCSNNVPLPVGERTAN